MSNNTTEPIDKADVEIINAMQTVHDEKQHQKEMHPAEERDSPEPIDWETERKLRERNFEEMVL